MTASYRTCYVRIFLRWRATHERYARSMRSCISPTVLDTQNPLRRFHLATRIACSAAGSVSLANATDRIERYTINSMAYIDGSRIVHHFPFARTKSRFPFSVRDGISPKFVVSTKRATFWFCGTRIVPLFDLLMRYSWNTLDGEKAIVMEVAFLPGRNVLY